MSSAIYFCRECEGLVYVKPWADGTFPEEGAVSCYRCWPESENWILGRSNG